MVVSDDITSISLWDGSGIGVVCRDNGTRRTFTVGRPGSILTEELAAKVGKRDLFVKRIMKWALQEPISDAEFAYYTHVAPTPESRIGHAVFPKAITGERRWLTELEKRVDATLLDRPMLLTMGLKDKPMTTRAFLAKFDEKFPKAKRVDLPKAGHYFHEDAPEEVAAAILQMYGATD